MSLTQPLRTQRPILQIATLADLKFVEHLQRKFSNQLGWLPRPALIEYLEAGRVYLVEENDDAAGYIATRKRLRSQRWLRPITQAAICLDAQRRHLGLALINAVADQATRDMLEALQCWIAADIEAVEFFRAAGFKAIATRTPQNARQRKLLLMRKSLNLTPHPHFHQLPTVAGHIPQRLTAKPPT